MADPDYYTMLWWNLVSRRRQFKRPPLEEVGADRMELYWASVDLHYKSYRDQLTAEWQASGCPQPPTEIPKCEKILNPSPHSFLDKPKPPPKAKTK